MGILSESTHPLERFKIDKDGSSLVGVDFIEYLKIALGGRKGERVNVVAVFLEQKSLIPKVVDDVSLL